MSRANLDNFLTTPLSLVTYNTNFYDGGQLSQHLTYPNTLLIQTCLDN